jgi:cell division protein FtsB
MPEAKRPEPKRRAPASRPGRPGDSGGRPRKAAAARRGPAASTRAVPEVVEPIRQAIVESAEQRSDQRLGLTARRAAILAAVICVLTLTIAGPVRTYFAQRTEMKQLAASESALRQQISELEQQKGKLGDPAFIAAQARERLGFVMPGEIPYQVQLPPGAVLPTDPGSQPKAAPSSDPWYTSLWHTIADSPHGPPTPAPPPPAPPSPNSLPPGG